MKRTLLLVLWVAFSAPIRAGDFDSIAIKALGPVAAYSRKENYSSAVSDVYLGYDADGKIVSAVAMRKINSYAPVTGLIAVTRKNEQWVISTAAIPDIARIKHKAKHKNVLRAIDTFSGRVVKDAEGKSKPVDTVTGATPYHQSLYLCFNQLTKTAVEVIEQNPDWPKMPLSH